VKSDQAAVVSASFVYGNSKAFAPQSAALMNGLSSPADHKSMGGLLLALGEDKRKLGILANVSSHGSTQATGYYEMDSLMRIVPVSDTASANMISGKVSIPAQVVTMEPASILLVDGAGRRWRLPKGDELYKGLVDQQALRICREVATERDLFNCAGTFYELPSENADGFAKIRPVTTHGLRINDYASFRGMLVMTGINPEKVAANNHIFVSADKQAAVWAGVIDDLWKMGKPTGKGGPWLNSTVSAGVTSDPYLFGGYDKRSVALSHQFTSAIDFTIQLDATGDGVWYDYKTMSVPAGKTIQYQFPDQIQSKWIRLVINQSATVSAQFDYK
jgi:hypothetical protein